MNHAFESGNSFLQNASISGKRWVLANTCERTTEAFVQKKGLKGITARILSARGLSLAQADNYLAPTLRTLLPDPYSLQDMEKAAHRLFKALELKESIAVFGDYDVDGATSGALLLRFFSQLGIHLKTYVPDRLKEGYGPNIPALKQLAKEGVKIILMVDCGTVAFEPLEQAKAWGLDVIVLDHHQASLILPPAYALINPNRLDEDLPHLTHLAAVGVTFLFLVALNRLLRDKGFYARQGICPPDLMSLLDLVALGTVCDVMPLTGLNRAFVAQGLKIMGQRQNLGLKTLCDFTNLHEAPNSYHLGFILGPRINAGGRVGKSDWGMRLLATEDPLEAKNFAHDLESWNQQRKEMESEALEEAILAAKTSPQSFSSTLYAPNWHQGIIGILASRIKDTLHRPTLILTKHNEIAKGSGRSISGLDLGQFIQNCVQKKILLQGGGHAMAGGFSLDLEKISSLREAFETHCKNLFEKQDMTPQILIDATLSLSGVTSDLMDEFQRLEPFGIGNPTPKILLSYVRIVSKKLLGEEGLPQHLRLELAQDTLTAQRLTAMAFRIQESPLRDAILSQDGKRLFHFVGTLKREWWKGQEQIRFIIEDGCYA